jgi:hypothetical protein
MSEKLALTEQEYKKVSLNFRKIASRFLQTDFREANDNLDRFLLFIEESPVIYKFIEENNSKKYEIESLIDARHYNEKFKLPVRTSDEIAFIYQLLKGISENERTYLDVVMGYNDGNKLQDAVTKFNQQVAKPLIDHIVSYLGEMAIDMGLDKKSGTQYHINGFRGQLNHAEGQSSVNANQMYSESKVEDLKDLSEKFVHELLKDNDIPPTHKDDTIEFIEAAIQQVEAEKPKKALIKMAVEKVNEVKEIAAAGSTVYTLGDQLWNLLRTFT